MVAREGSAPSISGCRPDVMLFHHRAKGVRVSDPPHVHFCSARRFQALVCSRECCGWDSRAPRSWLPGLDSHQHTRLQRALSYELDDPAFFKTKMENGGWNYSPSSIFDPPSSPQGLVEPEVVATSPIRIKSPVPVYCGFDSVKLVGERGLAPPRLADSRTAGSSIPA